MSESDGMGGIDRWYGWYMSIIGNIQNNIIYEIKSFYVTLTAGKFFQIIYIEQITILLICSEHGLICH
jgi:hypothetical protein